jgi:hypothetical protein
MPLDVYDPLKAASSAAWIRWPAVSRTGPSFSPRPKEVPHLCTKPDPLDYGDPIAYAEAENTYRHRTEDADAIELVRFSKRAPDAVITVQITLTEVGDARVLPR